MNSTNRLFELRRFMIYLFCIRSYLFALKVGKIWTFLALTCRSHEFFLFFMLFVLKLVQINSPTLARQGDGLGYIKIWATPLRKLVFWDGVPSPYKWSRSHVTNLIMCEKSPRVQKAQAQAQTQCSGRHSVAQRSEKKRRPGLYIWEGTVKICANK